MQSASGFVWSEVILYYPQYLNFCASGYEEAGWAFTLRIKLSDLTHKVTDRKVATSEWNYWPVGKTDLWIVDLKLWISKQNMRKYDEKQNECLRGQDSGRGLTWI